MKLYYNLMSTNCRRALAAAYHLNSKVELQSVDFNTDFCESPEFRKINPNGMLPAYEENGFTLFESNAIMQYLCDKAGNTTIYPQDAKIRADINRWQFWEACHFSPPCNTLMWENLLKKMFNAGPADSNEVAEATEEFRSYAKTLDEHLSTHKFLVNNQITIADYSIAASLTYAQAAQIPMNDYPNIKRWYSEIEKQDAWKKSTPKM